MDVNYTCHEIQGGVQLSSILFFLKFEYPCETRLPGSMGAPILSYNLSDFLIQGHFRNKTAFLKQGHDLCKAIKPE